jgi:hypothetical protein
VEQPPKKSTAREIVEKAAEATVSAVPLVGGPIAVVLATAMGAAYNRRMQAWFDDLARAVTELQETVVGWPPVDELAENDVFLDAVAQAAQAARATHQEEKLQALRNGVLNSLGSDAPEVDEQARFFRLLDQFTPAHLRLLAFLDDPMAVFDAAGIERPRATMGSRSLLVERHPDFVGRRAGWIDLISSDLTAASLTTHGGLHTMQSDDSLWLSATSPLGSRFLAFLRTPPALRNADEALTG